jgi:hypothetical protein
MAMSAQKFKNTGGVMTNRRTISRIGRHTIMPLIRASMIDASKSASSSVAGGSGWVGHGRPIPSPLDRSLT